MFSVFNEFTIEYWDFEADELKRLSVDVTWGWVAIIGATLIGNILLFYGFGTATERMNKRVRDDVFVALMRQEVSYYDSHKIGNISTSLEDDAAMIHSFSGEVSVFRVQFQISLYTTPFSTSFSNNIYQF